MLMQMTYKLKNYIVRNEKGKEEQQPTRPEQRGWSGPVGCHFSFPSLFLTMCSSSTCLSSFIQLYVLLFLQQVESTVRIKVSGYFRVLQKLA